MLLATYLAALLYVKAKETVKFQIRKKWRQVSVRFVKKYVI